MTSRIFTDRRDWPSGSSRPLWGYSIGRWIDEDGWIEEDGHGTYDLLELETRGSFDPEQSWLGSCLIEIDARKSRAKCALIAVSEPSS